MRKRKKISFEDSTFSRGGLQLLSPEFGQSLSHCHCKALHFKPIKWKVSVTIKRLLPQVVTLQDNRYNFVACDGTVCCDESGIFVTNSSWVAQCRVKLKKEIKRVSKRNRNFNCCFLMNDRFLWSRQKKFYGACFPQKQQQQQQLQQQQEQKQQQQQQAQQTCCCATAPPVRLSNPIIVCWFLCNLCF